MIIYMFQCQSLLTEVQLMYSIVLILGVQHSDMIYIQSVQSLSRVRLFATPWTAACRVSLCITNFQSLLKLMSIKSVMPSNHLILYCPFSSCPHSFPGSGSFPMSQLFASGCQRIRTSASASVLLMNIQDLFLLGLTSLISLQFEGLLSLLQYHSSKV